MGSASELAHVRQLGDMRRKTPVYGETEYSHHFISNLTDHHSYQLRKSTEAEANFDVLAQQREHGGIAVVNMMKEGGYSASNGGGKSNGRQAYDGDTDDDSDAELGGSRDGSDNEDDCDFNESSSAPLSNAMKLKHRLVEKMRNKLNAASAINGNQRLPIKRKRVRTETVTNVDHLEQFNYFNLLGPNLCPRSKLRQCNRLSNLHTETKRGNLEPCLLSYYASRTGETRMLIKEANTIPLDDPYRLNICLAKFPSENGVLVDKGYKGHQMFWPNCNRHMLPTFLEKRLQFEVEELLDDIDNKKLRYVAETIFSRAQTQRILKGVIDYGDLAIADDVYFFALGCANLMQPLRQPSDWKAYLDEIVIV